MQYKEYILIYLTLISGLACTNTLHGIGVVIKKWKEIKIDWVYFLTFFFYFFSIVDYWFHSFHFPYEPAEYNIFIFLIFLTPSSMLFFSTVIIFPKWTNRINDYTQFFKENLRSNIFIYALFIFSLLLKIYISHFMMDILFVPLLITLLICICIYILNSIRAYKILIILTLIMHLSRWVYQGVL